MTSCNEELEAGSRIQVVVRVRPVLPHEASEPVAVTCSQDGRKVQVALPERESSKPALAASCRPDARAYAFDACLTGSTTQAQLFDMCGFDELVEAAVDGYSCTVFAFGQTGSGKTFTMIGPSMAGFQEASMSVPSTSGAAIVPLQAPQLATPEIGNASNGEPRLHDDSSGTVQQQDHSTRTPSGGSQAAQQQPLGEDEGLLARCVAQLYSRIAERQQEVSCRVLASCCEIYNEAVTDLLARNKQQPLQVRQDSNTEAFYVEGLTQKEATDQHRALAIMAEALNFRHTRAHQLNTYSSRSHCLITFTVASQELQQGSRGGPRRTGKLVLVDLAGSERLKDTGNSAKEAVRETGAINKSLFTLGQVLAALSVRGGCGITGHVPYRDSRLTQLLWDGLRGGGHALMLACLSPLKPHADESLNTLHFASMALRIKSEPVIIMDPQDQMVLEMRGMIKALREDCRSLAGAIACMTSPGANISAVLQALPPTLVQDALRYGASSSAPANEQHGLSSPAHNTNGQRGAGRTRTSSGDRYKASRRWMKPSTADASLRHSLPTLLSYHSYNGGPQSPGKQIRSGNKSREQQAVPWNGSPSLHSVNARLSGGPMLPTRGPASSLIAGPGGSNCSRSNWPAYITPPRGVGSSNMNSQRVGFEVARGSLQGPEMGLGPYSFSSSLLGRSGTAENRSSASPWLGVSKYPGLAGRAAAVDSDGCRGAEGNVGSSHMDVSQAAAGSSMHVASKSAEDFPELAAMEQQFQQRLLQRSPGALCTGIAATQQLQPSASAAGLHTAGSAGWQEAVQFAGTGSSGVLVPSGLPASILQPRTLVPVRISVTDTETVGTNPGASPVVVAIAAADMGVRPLAVPLGPAGATVAESRLHRASGELASQVAAVPDGVPERKALHWAERNSWFGSDAEMTQLAYQVHDQLVESGVDPATDNYYTALESHVAAAFPYKWAQHLAILATTGAKAAAGRSRAAQPYSSPTAYVSYKMSLKPSVAAIRNSGATAGCAVSNARTLGSGRKATSPDQQRLQGPATAIVSQLVQHPTLTYQPTNLGYQRPSLQSQAASNSQVQQLPGRASAEEMAQLYEQHTQQARHQLPQQQKQQATADGSSSRATQQQRQQDAAHLGLTPHALAGLPELTVCASPVPAAEAGISRGANSPDAQAPAGELRQQTAGGACAVHCSSPTSAHGIKNSLSPIGANAHAAVTLMQQLQQSGQAAAALLVSGTSNTGNMPGGVTGAAAGQVLDNNAPSYYTGVGPLTTGARHSWTTSKYSQQVEAGKCLADVLRSGVSPGNQSLVELQADYRAARAQVLDQLRQQKEQAELQRQQILMQIGRAINSSKWRA